MPPEKPPIGEAAGKREAVEAMFDSIAPRYDLLNRVLSFGIDQRWRKKAIAWLRAQGDDILPILGASTLAQLDDNLGALDVHLTHAQLQRLDDASHVDLGFPGDFLARASVRPRIYAGVRDQIDARRESPAHP